MEEFLTLYEYKPAKSIGGNPSFMAAGIADPPWGYGLSEGRLSSTRTPTPAYPSRDPSWVSKPLTITNGPSCKRPDRLSPHCTLLHAEVPSLLFQQLSQGCREALTLALGYRRDLDGIVLMQPGDPSIPCGHYNLYVGV